jgi:phosphoribosyl-ATP pyrophosphohydrolase/phosphoribosyl-AMP cyclohydrolase
MNVDELRFDERGLIPAIVQSPSGDVRMLAWMNRDALQQTLDTQRVTFWSRSRQTLWTKGEQSGNYLRLKSVEADCDADTLLVTAEPEGPTCHRGTPTCFGSGHIPPELPWLGQLEHLLRQRKAAASPVGSYTQKLFAQGIDRIAKKVVEEAGEVILAAKNLQPGQEGPARAEFLGEAADLLFHLEMLLLDRGCALQDVVRVLHQRHAERASVSES